MPLTVQVNKEFKPKKDTRVLIAGVSGLLGSHLAEAITDMDIEVVGVDRFSKDQESNLARLVNRDNFSFVEADLIKGVSGDLRRDKVTHIIDATDVFPILGDKEIQFDEILNSSYGLRHLLDMANRSNAKLVYSSSVYIYQGLASHENLKNYYDGPELTSFYTFLEAKRYGEVLCHEYVEKFGLDVRIARLSEVYGPRMNLKSTSLLAKLIGVGLEKQDFVINEDGSQEHQLIYVDDAVFGLVKLLFSEKEKAETSIFYFINPERVSTLSVVYTLRSLIDQNLKIEFIPDHRKVRLPTMVGADISRTEKILKWDPTVDLTEGLKRTLRWFQVGRQDERSQTESVRNLMGAESSKAIIEALPGDIQEEQPITPEENHDVKPKGWLSQQISQKAPVARSVIHRSIKLHRFNLWEVGLVGFVLVLFFLAPLLVSFGYLAGANYSVRNHQFESGVNYTRQAKSVFELYRTPAFLIGLQDHYLAYEDLLGMFVFGIELLEDVEKISTPIRPVWETIQSSMGVQIGEGELTGEVLDNNLETIRSQVQSGLLHTLDFKTDFALFRNKSLKINENYLFGSLREQVRNIKELVWLYQPAAQNIDQILAGLPDVLGYMGSQRYVVWLQNNAEIRPTGGFIGSYAVISFENGKVVEFKVDDIYNPDGLLASHQDPPVPEILADQLGIDFIGLRDSNWWVEFPQGAEVFTDLYKRATNEQIDGVAAINLGVIKQLIATIGSVYVDEYEEEITSDNIFERAQFHSEIGFEPGSTQKKDFLSNLSNAVLRNLISNKQENLGGGIIKLVIEGFAARDIVVYSNQPELQNILSNSNLSGEFLDPEDLFTSAGRSMSDAIKVVDSNLGGNKANFWIKRFTEYSVSVDREGQLSAKLDVTWRHTGKSASWPNGDYLNYVRIYLPDGVGAVSTDPVLGEQSILTENGKVVLGGFVKVPIDTEKTVQVKYALPVELGITETNPYRIIWENQPGIDEEIRFVFNLPEFLVSSDKVDTTQQLMRPTFFEVSVDGAEVIP